MTRAEIRAAVAAFRFGHISAAQLWTQLYPDSPGVFRELRLAPPQRHIVIVDGPQGTDTLYDAATPPSRAFAQWNGEWWYDEHALVYLYRV
jgi:hypothetical protein